MSMSNISQLHTSHSYADDLSLHQRGAANAMDDRQQIENTAQTYFDSMYESSAEKAHAAFHPNAKITGYMRGDLLELTVVQFADFVGSKEPSPKDSGETARFEILSVEIAGDTAVARVRDDYDGLTFLDTLSMIKVDGDWRIYNKLFYAEGEAAAA